MIKNVHVLALIYCILGIIPLYCFFSDLIFSVLLPSNADDILNFDESFMNQIVFFTNWVNLFISVWAWCNLASLHNRKIPMWLANKNCDTMTVGLSIVIFIIYVPSLLNGTVPGFNTWYKIIKSVLEHIVMPIGIVLFYFFHKLDYVNAKRYACTYAFLPLIYQLAYGVFIYIRAGLLIYGYGADYIAKPPIFPYLQSDFMHLNIGMFILYVLLFFWGHYAILNFMNYVSNLRNIKYQPKRQTWATVFLHQIKQAK